MKTCNIEDLPIKNHGDTDAIFIDNVAAIIERGTVTHVILASVEATADSEFPAAMYRRVMVRLIIPTDRCYEIGKQIAARRAERVACTDPQSAVITDNLAELCHRD